MNIEIASYAELKATRDQIETRLREWSARPLKS